VDTNDPPTWRLKLLTMGLALATLSACSTTLPLRTTGMLGYGTPGVSAYVPDDNASSLQAQLDRCDQVPQAGATGQTQGLPAACGQLRRMVRNQPGNSVQPGQTR